MVLVGAYPHVSPTHLRLAFGILLLYLGFAFVLNPSDSRTGVALPAGIAALISTVAAWLFRRQATPKKPLRPPGSEHEYHI
jgi:hypothetical protein